MPAKLESNTRQGEILHKINPHNQDKPVVRSSVEVSERKTGQKLGNAEEKLGAHVTRMEHLLSEESDPRLKERIYARMINNLLVQSEDVPEAYWQLLDQIDRNHGFPAEEWTEDRKKWRVGLLRDAQRAGLDSWVQHIDEAEYDMWFKLYVIDGMSKLGTWNTSKHQYNERSKGTIAPYPRFNAEAFAKTYEEIQAAYDSQTGASDEKREKTSNFNKIYSKYIVECGGIVETPERTEDIQGEWRRYSQEEGGMSALMDASAENWCTAGEHMAERYIKDSGDEFCLYHLQNPATGAICPTAAIAVRLHIYRNHSDGVAYDEEVSEVSGLANGSVQDVEPSLLPILREKMLELHGGESYLRYEEDNNRLIAMDRKYQAGKPFTLNELRFLYEVDRHISLRSSEDIRVQDFRQDREQHVTQFVAEYGAENGEWHMMSDKEIYENIERLVAGGADVGQLAKRVERSIMSNLRYLEDLHNAGVPLDVDEIAMEIDRTRGVDAHFLNVLVKCGGDIDKINLDWIIAEPESWIGETDVIRALVSGGHVNIDEISTYLEQRNGVQDLKVSTIDTLVSLGLNAERLRHLIKSQSLYWLQDNLRALIEAGVDVGGIIDNDKDFYDISYANNDSQALWTALSPALKIANSNWFARQGVDLDIDATVKNCSIAT